MQRGDEAPQTELCCDKNLLHRTIEHGKLSMIKDEDPRHWPSGLRKQGQVRLQGHSEGRPQPPMRRTTRLKIFQP